MTTYAETIRERVYWRLRSEGDAWCSGATLAKVLGLNVTTVKRCLRQLGAEGYILHMDRYNPITRRHERLWTTAIDYR